LHSWQGSPDLLNLKKDYGTKAREGIVKALKAINQVMGELIQEHNASDETPIYQKIEPKSLETAEGVRKAVEILKSFALPILKAPERKELLTQAGFYWEDAKPLEGFGGRSEAKSADGRLLGWFGVYPGTYFTNLGAHVPSWHDSPYLGKLEKNYGYYARNGNAKALKAINHALGELIQAHNASDETPSDQRIEPKSLETAEGVGRAVEILKSFALPILTARERKELLTQAGFYWEDAKPLEGFGGSSEANSTGGRLLGGFAKYTRTYFTNLGAHIPPWQDSPYLLKLKNNHGQEARRENAKALKAINQVMGELIKEHNVWAKEHAQTQIDPSTLENSEGVEEAVNILKSYALPKLSLMHSL
jgi:hypothetical protein